MTNETLHPGAILSTELAIRKMSQRQLASKIEVAHSVLNNIISGNRNININLAISLEAAGFKNALFWLSAQNKYSLNLASKESSVIKMKEWVNLSKIVPVEFFKKLDFLNIKSSDDIHKIYEFYKVDDYKELLGKVNAYNPKYFRKSAKLKENRNNILAWSIIAEHRAENMTVPIFDSSCGGELNSKLKLIFYKNRNTVIETEKLLRSFGIKFFTLDRPGQTPVDGKSFMSDGNPAIVLSLKYKRLDNFAFTLFHELGHVFKHLVKAEYCDSEFFVKNPEEDILEFQADSYAKNQLIDSKLWSDFKYSNETFTDDIILDFSKKSKIHPGIIRGRVCFENQEYYKKRSVITAMNKLA